MDDLSFLREHVKSYADYTLDGASRLTDEQVRAYVGIAVARIFERLTPTGLDAEALSNVLTRCEFADQHVARALETSAISELRIAALHAVDRELVILADRSSVIDAVDLAAYCAEIDRSLDRRAALAVGANP